VAWFNITASIFHPRNFTPFLLILFTEFFLFQFSFSFHEAEQFMYLDFWVTSTKAFQFNNSEDSRLILFLSWDFLTHFSFILSLSSSYIFCYFPFPSLSLHVHFIMETSSFLKEEPFWLTFPSILFSGGMSFFDSLSIHFLFWWWRSLFNIIFPSFSFHEILHFNSFLLHSFF